MNQPSGFRRGEQEMHNEIPDQISPAFSPTFRMWVRLLQALDAMPVRTTASQPCTIDPNLSHGDAIDVKRQTPLGCE
jgi:hypothetical protein